MFLPPTDAPMQLRRSTLFCRIHMSFCHLAGAGAFVAVEANVAKVRMCPNLIVSKPKDSVRVNEL